MEQKDIHPDIGFCDASAEVIDIINKILGNKWKSSTSEELVHYTNLQGMKGIIEDGGFWLSDIRFLNDSEEYENGKIITQEILNKYIKQSEDIKVTDYLNGCLKKLKQPLEKTYYIASFSKNKDSLEQWRAYSKGTDGVALVFANNQEMTSHFQIHPTMSLSDVIYDDEVKKNLIDKIVEIFVLKYKKTKNTTWIEQWEDDFIGGVSLLFNIFKNKAFEKEEEVRAILTPLHVGKEYCPLNFRTSNGHFIPYTSSKYLYNNESIIDSIVSEPLPLKEVIVGPIANQKITKDSIKVYLEAKEYKDIKITSSSIPFRG